MHFANFIEISLEKITSPPGSELFRAFVLFYPKVNMLDSVSLSRCEGKQFGPGLSGLLAKGIFR